MWTEVAHHGVVRLVTGRLGQVVENVATGECVALPPGSCWQLAFDDASGFAFVDTCHEVDVVEADPGERNFWVNRKFRLSLHESASEDGKQYVRDRAAGSSTLLSDHRMAHSTYALNHSADGVSMGMAVCMYSVAVDGSHAFWELPYVQHALHGSCARKRWMLDSKDVWKDKFAKLGLPESTWKGNLASARQTAIRLDGHVPLQALVGTPNECSVSTVGLIVVLSACTKGHSRKKSIDMEGPKAEELMFLLADRFLAKRSVRLSLLGDMSCDSGPSGENTLVVDDGCVPYTFVARHLGKTEAAKSRADSLAIRATLSEEVVFLSSFLLACGRSPNVISGKAIALRNVFLGLARSFGIVVDASRCEAAFWSDSHRGLPTLEGSAKRRKASIDLKLEVSDVALKANLTQNQLLTAVEVWQGADPKGGSVRNPNIGRDWDWSVMWNYNALGRLTYQRKAPMCVAFDEVEVGDKYLFTCNWNPATRDASWWPTHVVQCTNAYTIQPIFPKQTR
jgi:hypothetical protein